MKRDSAFHFFGGRLRSLRRGRNQVFFPNCFWVSIAFNFNLFSCAFLVPVRFSRTASEIHGRYFFDLLLRLYSIPCSVVSGCSDIISLSTLYLQSVINYTLKYFTTALTYKPLMPQPWLWAFASACARAFWKRHCITFKHVERFRPDVICRIHAFAPVLFSMMCCVLRMFQESGLSQKARRPDVDPAMAADARWGLYRSDWIPYPQQDAVLHSSNQRNELGSWQLLHPFRYPRLFGGASQGMS